MTLFTEDTLFGYNCKVRYDYFDGELSSRQIIVRTYAKSGTEALMNVMNNIGKVLTLDDHVDIRGFELADDTSEECDATIE